MSTATPVRTALGSGFRLAPAEAVLTRRLMYEMWKVARWFWPVAVLVAVLIEAIIASVAPITQSAWEYAAQWPRWWLFSMGITLIVTYLPVVVAHGVTRRAALRALATSAVLVAATWATFMVIGHIVERFVYGRLGWPDTLTTPHLFSNGYQVLPVFTEYSVIFLAYLVSGGLIGAGYYRWGGIRGTLLLPLGLLPVAAVESLLATGWYGAGLQELSFSRPPAAVLVIASAVALGLGWLALYLVLRDVPIKSQK